MRKFRILTLIAIAMTAYATMSFTNRTSVFVNPLDTKVSWAKESYDFGEIAQGKPVSVDFKFKNDGSEPVIISEVVTSCGCTASDYTKEPIAPGKSSVIKVSYNAVAMGTFNKSITVNFNDAASKKILTIKGIVK